MTDPKKPTAGELLEAIHEMHLDDELERIAALSDGELDAEMRGLKDRDGQTGDPEGTRARGAAFAAKEIARIAAREDFETKAAERLARALSAADAAPKTPALPRKELLARINAATKRPSLAAPIMIAFKKRKREDASDAELRSFLDRIAELEAIAEAEGLDVDGRKAKGG